jgi:hypothetical protein
MNKLDQITALLHAALDDIAGLLRKARRKDEIDDLIADASDDPLAVRVDELGQRAQQAASARDYIALQDIQWELEDLINGGALSPALAQIADDLHQYVLDEMDEIFVSNYEQTH